MIDKRIIANKNLSRKDRKLETEFSLSSNFSVDELLFSGRVLYGDVLSRYVNKVADKVLESNPELRSELRFYVLKSYNVNAFSTNQGILFVTVGLLSQVENEAQLAFILCHEIAHYVKKHNLEAYKKNKEIIKGKGKFKQLDFESRLKEVYNYSKEHEIEADKEGFLLFSKTGYAVSEALSSLDMLLYSYLAYDEIDWNKKELQDSFFKFPEDYTPKKLREIAADEAKEDVNSTHPNIKKRKEFLKIEMDKVGKGGTKLFVQDKSAFEFVQQQARIELFFILLNHADYQKAYYLAYLYKKIYKDKLYSDKIMAYCMYGKSMQIFYRKSDKYTFRYVNKEISVTGNASVNNSEGNMYAVNHFFNSLNKEEIAVLSVRTAWNAYIKDPSDSFYHFILNETMRNLFYYTDITFKEFITSIDTTKTIDTLINELPANNNLSKVEKLKQLQKKQAAESKEEKEQNPENYKLAFIDFLSNSYFSEQLNIAFAYSRDRKAVAATRVKRKYNTWKFERKYGNSAQVDSMVMINPYFQKMAFKGNKVKYNRIYNEYQELWISGKYKDLGEANGLFIDYINLLDKNKLNTEKINQYSELVEWLSERYFNQDPNTRMFNTQHILNATSSGSTKLCISGLSYTVQKSARDDLGMYAYLLVPPLWPYFFFYFYYREHTVYLNTIVYDLKTGQIQFSENSEYFMKYRTDYLNAHIYSIFNQIKRK